MRRRPDAGRLRRFVPFDVCEPVLRDAAATIAARYDGLGVIAVVGDFEHHLDEIPDIGRSIISGRG